MRPGCKICEGKWLLDVTVFEACRACKPTVHSLSLSFCLQWIAFSQVASHLIPEWQVSGEGNSPISQCCFALTILTYDGSTQWHLPKGCENAPGSQFQPPSCVLSGHLAAQNWVLPTRGHGLETQKVYLPSGRSHPWVAKSPLCV